MNWKKLPFSIVLELTILFTLCSCTQSRFLAGSADPKNGGIYKINSAGEVLHGLHAPTLNYLIRSKERPLLYATLGKHLKFKSRNGAAAVIRELPGGFLMLEQIYSAGGRGPCHLTLSPDGKFLYTANYSSGDISELPLNEKGLVAGIAKIFPHTGKSVTKRQKGPHPHQVLFDPAGKQLFVCDLGTDEIWIYDYTPGKGIRTPRKTVLKLPPGSGVRHLAFSPDGNTLYTANELNSTSTSFRREHMTSPWKKVMTSSTLPDKSKAEKNYPGAIRITQSGDYFLITNRGDNTLALFKTLPGGKFKLLQTIASGGNYPSDILIFPDGKNLAVIHLKSSNITRFTLDAKAGKLIRKPGSIPVKKGITLSL